MKLELKHLAPYLPYGLKIKCENFPIGDGIRTFELDCGHDIHFYLAHGFVKPILKPLSDYEKSFDEWYSMCWQDFNYFCTCIQTGNIEYSIMEHLIEQHYDVFGLIDAGLAIDINTFY